MFWVKTKVSRFGVWSFSWFVIHQRFFRMHKISLNKQGARNKATLQRSNSMAGVLRPIKPIKFEAYEK